MPAVARKDGVDSVSTNHGCDGSTVTDTGSGNVFANNIGVVRANDLDRVHRYGGRGCSLQHQQALSSYSGNVFANNKNIGRLGDAYGGETISSGSPNVFANS
jgi:hypothetical protein